MKNRFLYIMMGTLFTMVVLFQACKRQESSNGSSTGEAGSSPLDVALSDKEMLGRKIFFDNISSPNTISCATCHDPAYGFTGPDTGQNLRSGIYSGAITTRFGNRKPPSAAYATFSPIFFYDADDGVFMGGNFWDGRATGEQLGDPAAEQAIGPFLNPVEQNHASREDVLKQIAESDYASLWTSVWGEPINYTTPEHIEDNYNKLGRTLSAYEASAEVNSFTSRFDYYLKNMVKLSDEEMKGMELFNGKAKCNLCHISDGEKPLFTDFTFDNLGIPKNPENPFYKMNTVYLPDGSAINPQGSKWIDSGLGGFLETHSNPAWKSLARDNWGKHKVPTLRNVDKRPDPDATKAYMHNGVFKSLKEVVHFYNTRDTRPWPAPEVAQNVNTDKTGNLGLTDEEENAVVAFMKTLSDGYVIK
jgi:cytochrome c peroxidase